MSDTCKVVRVVSKEHAEYGGFKEINESDLTKDHVIWKEPAVASVSDPFSEMSADDLRAYLTGMGIAFQKHTGIDALRAKCRTIQKG